MKQDQIPSLTGLRFIAAFCVVVSHALPVFFNLDPQPRIIGLLSTISAEGMTLFFVLSGFVIFLNYSQSIGTWAGLWNFFVARFARLYPLYFVCLSFDLLMSLKHHQFPSDRVGAIPFYLSLTQSWFYFPISGNALIYQFGSMPSVSWSISTEWFFYCVFPSICIAISALKSNRSRIIAAVSLSVAAITIITTINSHMEGIQNFGTGNFGSIAATWPDGLFRWLVYFSPYVRIFEFALGCLSAAIVISLPAPSGREQIFGAVLMLAAIAAIVGTHWLMFGVSSDTPVHWLIQRMHMNFGFAPMMAILIFCGARYNNSMVRFLSGKFIVFAGEASYSIYLLHPAIIERIPPAITLRGFDLGTLFPFVAAMAAIMCLALISWTFIEVPSRQAIRRILFVRTSDKTSTVIEAA